MPKYSLIIPIYNVEEYIDGCINSILSQNFTDYEVLLINDGSTDQSAAKAAAIASQYPNTVRVITQENKGLGGARNTGIDQAKGEYLIFIDSDDTVTSNMLFEIDKELIKTNAKMAVFDFRMVDEVGNYFNYTKGCQIDSKVFNIEENPEVIFMPNTAWNKVYHRSLFIESGIRFPEREWFEDLSTTLKLYPLTESIVYIDKCFYNYLQRSNSIMSSKNIARNREIITAAERVLSFYRENDFFEKYKNELEYFIVLHVMILATVRVVKNDRKSPLLEEFRQYILTVFPDFSNNPYVQKMTLKERLIIKLVLKKRYFSLKLLLKLNDILKKEG